MSAEEFYLEGHRNAIAHALKEPEYIQKEVFAALGKVALPDALDEIQRLREELAELKGVAA